MKKRFLSVLGFAVILSLLAFPTAASVALQADETSRAEGTIDATLLLSGQKAVNNAVVRGILFAAGFDVEANGSSEYTFAAGYNVRVEGHVENDAFLAGFTVSIPGSVARDVCAVGQSVSIDGTVGRDLHVAANTVDVTGTVMGDLYIDASNIHISDEAVIHGTLTYNDNASIQAPQELLRTATVYESDTEEIEEAVEETADELSAAAVVGKLVRTLVSYIGLVLVAFLLLWLTPLWKTADKRYEGATFGKYAAAFGIGLAVLICVPIVCVLLLISGVGVRLALLAAVVYAAFILVSPTVLGFVLGALLLRKAFHREPCYPAELAVGLLLVKLVSLIPGVSVLIALVGTAFGVGSLTMLLGSSEKKAEVLPTSEENTHIDK